MTVGVNPPAGSHEVHSALAFPCRAVQVRRNATPSSMVVMTDHIFDEDWTIEDLDRLLRLAWTNLDEALRCHQNDVPHAALVLLACAFEAVLLGAVISHEEDIGVRQDELTANKCWPQRPSRMHLTELVRLARTMGWVEESIRGEAIGVLTVARNMAAHPGAYVRGTRQFRAVDPDLDVGDPRWYGLAYKIVLATCRELFPALGVAPAPS